jgi:hypothetical protein
MRTILKVGTGLLVAVCSFYSLHAQTNAAAPHIGNCPIFPQDNVWNTPIDALPAHVKSDTYLQSIGLATTLHPDFGSSPNYGIPLTPMPPATKGVKVAFEYRDESDLGNYPIPPDPLIEGGSAAPGDRHILFIDPRRCILYELYAAKPMPDGSWKAGSGIKMDLTSNALRGDGKTSADAAGLPILPGLVRYDEVEAGEIRHALRFTIPKTQHNHIWPARHDASSKSDANLPPMGLRLRLRKDFDISGYSKPNQIILRALQTYGMILADNGAAIFLSGMPDARWNVDDLHKLTAVTGHDFEVVDESGWQMMADSARVDPAALH